MTALLDKDAFGPRSYHRGALPIVVAGFSRSRQGPPEGGHSDGPMDRALVSRYNNASGACTNLHARAQVPPDVPGTEATR
jgi:hypothetical protein